MRRVRSHRRRNKSHPQRRGEAEAAVQSGKEEPQREQALERERRACWLDAKDCLVPVVASERCGPCPTCSFRRRLPWQYVEKAFLHLHSRNGVRGSRRQWRSFRRGRRCVRHCRLRESNATCVLAQKRQGSYLARHLGTEILQFPTFRCYLTQGGAASNLVWVQVKRHRAPNSEEVCLPCRAGSSARDRVCRSGGRRQRLTRDRAGEENEWGQDAFPDIPYSRRTDSKKRWAANKTIHRTKRQKASRHSGKEPSPMARS